MKDIELTDVTLTDEQKDRLRLWVANLRSGRFVQGEGALCTVNPDDGQRTYCCLGVLVETAIESGLDLIVAEDSGVNGSVHYGRQRDTGVLPEEVVEWSGLPDHNPHMSTEPESDLRGYKYLTEMNDLDRSSFTQIANTIEREYGLADEAPDAGAV